MVTRIAGASFRCGGPGATCLNGAGADAPEAAAPPPTPALLRGAARAWDAPSLATPRAAELAARAWDTPLLATPRDAEQEPAVASPVRGRLTAVKADRVGEDRLGTPDPRLVDNTPDDCTMYLLVMPLEALHTFKSKARLAPSMPAAARRAGRAGRQEI